jgi:hypothetical protein
MQHFVGRIDAEAVANQALREHWVGNFLDRQAPAGQR